MLTKDQVINAGLKYILLEACGEPETHTFSLVLTQQETFTCVPNGTAEPPFPDNSIITIHGWNINEDNDAKYDVIYDYLMKQRIDEMMNERFWWYVVATIAYRMSIDVDWEWENVDEMEDEEVEPEELSPNDAAFMEELNKCGLYEAVTPEDDIDPHDQENLHEAVTPEDDIDPHDTQYTQDDFGRVWKQDNGCKLDLTTDEAIALGCELIRLAHIGGKAYEQGDDYILEINIER